MLNIVATIFPMLRPDNALTDTAKKLVAAANFRS